MESVGEPETWVPKADRKEMDVVFHLCRRDDWKGVLAQIERNPWISITPMIMDNNITTTCLHQAITSKASIQDRAKVIRRILEVSPEAARIKNGYGSLPLHVIAQRNTKMKSETKEELIFELVRAYPGALVEEGGVGKRTPLHIIFTGTYHYWSTTSKLFSSYSRIFLHTDYVSPRLTRMMVDQGAQACFMKDKKGYLPAHVAASRHCSPEKLRMLLAVNPDSLVDATADGETLLSLATSTATKSHPNYALIEELHRQYAQLAAGHPTVASNGRPPMTVLRSMDPTASTPAPLPRYSHAQHGHQQHYQHQHYYHHHHPHQHPSYAGFGSPLSYAATPVSGSSQDSESSRGRLDSNDSHKSSSNGSWPSPPPPHPPPQPVARKKVSDPTTSTAATSPAVLQREKKRKSSSSHKAEAGDEPKPWLSSAAAPVRHYPLPLPPFLDDPVGLLLHFSQAATTTTPASTACTPLAPAGSIDNNRTGTEAQRDGMSSARGRQQRQVAPHHSTAATTSIPRFQRHSYHYPGRLHDQATWPCGDDGDDEEEAPMNFAQV
jgi:hypothetical protein